MMAFSLLFYRNRIEAEQDKAYKTDEEEEVHPA